MYIYIFFFLFSLLLLVFFLEFYNTHRILILHTYMTRCTTLTSKQYYRICARTWRYINPEYGLCAWLEMLNVYLTSTYICRQCSYWHRTRVGKSEYNRGTYRVASKNINNYINLLLYYIRHDIISIVEANRVDSVSNYIPPMM